MRPWYDFAVKQIPISKFKATCLGVIQQVQKTKTPIRVTRFGQPMADVVPAAPDSKSVGLGFMAGRMRTHGDLVHATPWLDSQKRKRSK